MNVLFKALNVVLAIVSFIPLSTQRCLAAGYYVDSIGGSDSNSGMSSSSPWKSLVHLHHKRLVPGDFIYLKAGSTFSSGLNISASGNSSSPITFSAYGSGAAPVISNDGTYGSHKDAIKLSGSYVIVDGFKLTTASYSGVNVRGRHNIVRNCEMTDVGIGVTLAGSNNLVTHNYAHDLKMVVNDAKLDNDYGANGVLITAPHNEYSYNSCVRCQAPSHDYGMDGGAVEFFNTVDGAYIHHNYAQESNGFLEVGGRPGHATGVRISYNVSVNDGPFGEFHLSDKFASTVSDFHIENNTIIEPTATERDLIWMDTPPAAKAIFFRNNIVVVRNFDHIFSFDVNRSNNVYQFLAGDPQIVTGQGAVLERGEMLVNPKFVSLNGNDFHLQSPGRRTALSLGGAIDNDAVAVPATSPDIGAYQ